MGNRGHEPLAVQAVQVGKCSLGYGLRQGHLALVGRSPISFRSLRVLPVVDGQAHIPVLLTRRKTFTFLRSGGDRQPASAHCPGDGQRGPPVLEPLPNQHVRLLPGMDGNVGRDSPLLQEVPGLARFAGSVRRQ